MGGQLQSEHSRMTVNSQSGRSAPAAASALSLHRQAAAFPSLLWRLPEVAHCDSRGRAGALEAACERQLVQVALRAAGGGRASPWGQHGAVGSSCRGLV